MDKIQFQELTICMELLWNAGYDVSNVMQAARAIVYDGKVNLNDGEAIMEAMKEALW